ncbi:FAD-binding oxidoreductase [Rhodococcus oryzae]|uniref:FAD-binding oxidoreductase n=1 Tax=Rhodococcus oryzae TaxID=2571143 RepID=UPI003793E601
MTEVSDDLGVLRSAIDGPVFGPDDTGYDKARSIWNGDIDHRPLCVARCVSAGDVGSALGFARDRELEVSVRGGGHAYSGTSVSEGGLMIDLSELNGTSVEPETGMARIGGGATMADLDAATQAHGLAVTGGVISHTGVGGLTLGGGMGWLTRLAGLSIDNLESAEVVLADGSVVRASDDEHPDLFWALRGGGGNFGVVTEFEYRLHPVGPEVNLGLFFWSLDDGAAALRLCQEFIPTLPARAGCLIAAGMCAPPEPFVPEQFRGMSGHALIVAGYSSAAEHASTVAPIRDTLAPLFEFVTPIPYTGLQQMFDGTAPWGILGYEKALDLDALTDEVIAVIVEQVPRKSSPLSFMPIFRLDGAFTAVGEDDSAFGGARTPHYVCNISGMTDTPEVLAADRAWTRSIWEALRPLSSNQGSYVNFMAEPDEDRVRAAYGPCKYDRLAAVKSRYDPDNTFHLNANIKPA